MLLQPDCFQVQHVAPELYVFKIVHLKSGWGKGSVPLVALERGLGRPPEYSACTSRRLRPSGQEMGPGVGAEKKNQMIFLVRESSFGL